MSPVLMVMAGHDGVADALLEAGMEPGRFDAHHFPDGETRLRIDTPVHDREAVILCGLDHANARALDLLLMVETLRDLGAKRVGLVTPYLGYMRQDKRFHDGEGISSRYFADILSRHLDWLVTVDPHLHRWRSLSDIYPIPSRAVHAAPVIARFLRNRSGVFLLGPDAESEQWVSDIAEKAGLPWAVASKERHGDTSVTIQLPDLDRFRNLSPVLVDDVISSGGTVAKAVKQLCAMGFKAPEVLCVHALFAPEAEQRLREAGVADVMSTNTIPHGSNRIDMGPAIATAVRELLG